VSPSEQTYRPATASQVAGRPGDGPGADSSRGQVQAPPAAPRAGAVRAAPEPPTPAGPRKVRLTVARADPWSVLKLSFLLSVALGLAMVVSVIILWVLLKSMGVFDDLNGVLQEIGGKNSPFDIYDYVGLGRVISLTTFVAVINVVIIMALSTLGAFLYNLSASLVGGLQVTLSDD
jgi:hypothetical protein